MLRDNYEQATALGNARRAGALAAAGAPPDASPSWSARGQLNRALEALPTDEELARPAEAGEGLTAPEFAVLLAYVKIVLESEILADPTWSTRRGPPRCWSTTSRPRCASAFAERMAGHRLRREIVTTVLVNEVVNRGGTSFVYRAVEETGATAADVIRAYVVVRDVYGLPELWAAVEALDNEVPTEAQTAVYLEARRLLDRAVRWLVSNRRSPIDVAGEIARLRPGVAGLLPQLGHAVRRRGAGGAARRTSPS